MRLRSLTNGRGIWALADQALLSAGNFCTNILLIRHLSPDRFGNYAVLFSVVLFLNNLHASLVTYPLSVMAGTDNTDAFRSRVRSALILTGLLALPLGVALAAVAFCMGGAALAIAVVAAMGLWQIQETLRRSLMARLQHYRAVPGDAVSYLGQAFILLLLVRWGTITPLIAFVIIAATSLLAAVVQAVQLRIFAGVQRGDWVAQAKESWSLGRWVLLSSLVGLVTVYATPWILRYCHGSKEVAAYQALSNLLGVSNPIIASMAGLIVPAVAEARSHFGPRAARAAAGRYGLQGATLLLPYYAVLLIAPTFALRLFYGSNSPYLAFATPLRLFVVIYSMYYFCQVLFGLLNGLGKSQWSFYAQSWAAITNAAVCLPLAAVVGLIGTVWGGLAPMLVQLAVAVLLLRRLFSRSAIKPTFAVADEGLQPLAGGAA